MSQRTHHRPRSKTDSPKTLQWSPQCPKAWSWTRNQTWPCGKASPNPRAKRSHTKVRTLVFEIKRHSNRIWIEEVCTFNPTIFRKVRETAVYWTPFQIRDFTIWRKISTQSVSAFSSAALFRISPSRRTRWARVDWVIWTKSLIRQRRTKSRVWTTRVGPVRNLPII